MAKLSITPKEAELEDFVAAYFQTSKYFVEKNIIHKDVEEIQELDAVVTTYPNQLPSSILVEVKSGKWRMVDLFKLLGQKTFLKIPNAVFFTTYPPKHGEISFYKKTANQMNIRLIFVGDIAKINDIVEKESFPKIGNERLFSIWRFSYWIERCLLQSMRQYRKINTSSLGVQDISRYYQLVNNRLFFTKNIHRKIYYLYKAFQDHPKITLGMASELEGNEYNPHTADPDSEILREAIYEGRHLILQYCMYLEHRARLTLLKTAVDYLLLKESGLLEKSELDKKLTIGTLFHNILPNNFYNAIDELEKYSYYKKLPHFWQLFLWAYGGFILTDREQEEYEYLSKMSGIPATDIDTALNYYNILFPSSTGWFQDVKSTHIRIIKLVPLHFRGIGAFHRLINNDLNEYSEFGYKDYTTKDLSRWHNLSAKLLDTKGHDAT